MPKYWMIYGANGYTGRLISEEAKRRGLSPILAGRSASITELGRKLQLPTRIFSLETPQQIAKNLDGVSAVLHCAGPFSATSQKMVEACLLSKTHYFDITGEIDVFEQIHAQDAEFKRAGIIAIPGVGFDVVPTDCVAAMLKKQMPDATRLRLAFKSDGGPSAGTAKSSIEGIAKGGRVRVNGKIVPVGLAAKSLNITYDERPVFSMLIPWGDVSTAFYSTGIPNIEVYMAAPKSMARTSKLLGYAMKLPLAERVLKELIQKTVHGPSVGLLESGRSFIWGEVQNAAGKTATRRIVTPMGYKLTVDSALTSVTKALTMNLRPGALTPSQAFGAEFILELAGTKLLQ